VGKHLVLVGGGHAHLPTLIGLREFVERGHRVTLISPSAYHYYSGMGPGLLGGLYQPEEIRFHVRRMAEDRGAAFLADSVIRIDPGARRLFLASGGVVPYDLVSFNIGSEVAAEGVIAPAQTDVFPVKPIVNLIAGRREILSLRAARAPRFVIGGGGPAGLEVAGNLWRLTRDPARRSRITILAGVEWLPRASAKVRRLARRSLKERGIELVEGSRVRSMKDGRATLANGGSYSYDLAFAAFGVRPPNLFRDSGIPTGDDGALLVHTTLRSVAHPEIFGGGDCIRLSERPLDRVGVYAVRQGPVLRHNLLSALDAAELRPFRGKGRYLLIFDLGDGTAIWWKGKWVWSGRLALWLKQLIDRRFMGAYQVSGEMKEMTGAGDPEVSVEGRSGREGVG
jgi:NADH dehydrogenase FAD-containing subunit